LTENSDQQRKVCKNPTAGTNLFASSGVGAYSNVFVSLFSSVSGTGRGFECPPLCNTNEGASRVATMNPESFDTRKDQFDKARWGVQLNNTLLENEIRI
jgi:hypothetical protein